MVLLAVYTALTAVGLVALYFVGLAVEGIWPIASLPIFLVAFFLMLWVAWILAVRLTASKGESVA